MSFWLSEVLDAYNQEPTMPCLEACDFPRQSVPCIATFSQPFVGRRSSLCHGTFGYGRHSLMFASLDVEFRSHEGQEG